MPITIYHNPRCSKSRQTLELLEANGFKPLVIEYLKTPPSAIDLDHILKLLDLNPQDIVRTKETLYDELKLKGKSLSRDEWIKVLVDHPALLERPIVVNGGKAALGRPPEHVLSILY